MTVRVYLTYLAIFVILMIPMSFTNMVASRAQNGMFQDEQVLEDVPKELLNKEELTPEGDVNFDMLFFTETSSSNNGLYYVCRRGRSLVAYFGVSTVHFMIDDSFLTVEFPGSAGVIPKGERPTGSVTNYFYGSDSTQWKTGLNNYAAIRYKGIYPDIDLVYKIQDGEVKYEFVIEPNADPSVIRILYPDADSVEAKLEEVIVKKEKIRMADSELRVFQNRGKIKVKAAFENINPKEVAVKIGDYDTSMELVIDPVITLAYSTYLGGSSNEFTKGIAVEDGYMYIVGELYSSNFPMQNANDSSYNGNRDCFVTKLAVDGQSLIYSTYLGGTQIDSAQGIAVENGYAYVTGFTASTNFPMQNANDSSHNGDLDCFLTKFSADGQSLVYSTYLGGPSDDIGYDIAVDNEYTYVTGYTQSDTFPLQDPYDSTYGGATECFVTRFENDGQSFVYSTYLGGTNFDYGFGIAVENGAAYVTGYTNSADFPTLAAFDDTYNLGYDIFIAKIWTSGGLIYSTYLGGMGSDYGYGIAVEDGCAYVTGYTRSNDFPMNSSFDSTYNSNDDCIVAKLSDNGKSLVYSTYLGGYANDHGRSIEVEEGIAYVTGETQAAFPLINTLATQYGGYDCFTTKLTVDGQFCHYSTTFGNSSNDHGYGIAVENGIAYVAGQTSSSSIPLVNAYDDSFNGGIEGFIAIYCDDSDFDGLNDWEETTFGTSPILIDTDSDNFLDGYEVDYGSDPLDAMSYPAIPQAWYDEIYEDLDGNATLIQNLITWSDGNASLLETVMQQLDDNATLLIQVIAWLDGNHSAIETLFTQLDGNATLLEQTVSDLEGNSTLIQNLVLWCDGNSSLLQTVIQQLDDNATLLTHVISWLDGNHTAIETLYTQLAGNATLLMYTVNALNGNVTLIQNLLSWSAGNETLLLNVIDQVNELETDISQVVEWLNGNHTQIEILLTYVEGNATLLLQTVSALNENATRLDLIAALVTGNTDWLQELNATVIGNITEIRGVLDQLGVTVGDTDYDGLDDLDELVHGTDILCIDTDTDNLNDAFEIKIGTDPLDDDSDGDSYLDGVEVIAGTDPLDANDYPRVVTTTTPTETTTPTTTSPPEITTTTTSSSSPPSEMTTMMIVILIAGVGMGIVVAVVIQLFLKKRNTGS